MTSRYQQLKMEFGGEEVAAESLREALKFARRAVERGDKVTHPDVVMLLDMFEMESGHEAAEAAPCECEVLRERLKTLSAFHEEGARRLKQRIAELEEEVRLRSNALTRRITQVSVLQTDLEAANSLIENLSRKVRDWEQRSEAGKGQLWKEATEWPQKLSDVEKKLADTLRANKQQKELLKTQEAQLEAQAETLKVAEDKLAMWRKYGVLDNEARTGIVDKFASALNTSVPFFARKNKEYGNAIESTGVRGSVVALTGDVARLRVMLREPELDMANLRDKLQDVLVQAGIGIVLLDAGNVDGKGV